MSSGRTYDFNMVYIASRTSFGLINVILKITQRRYRPIDIGLVSIDPHIRLQKCDQVTQLLEVQW